jgi:hypothetical protein
MLIDNKTVIQEVTDDFCQDPKPETRQAMQKTIGFLTNEELALMDSMEALRKRMDDIDLLGTKTRRLTLASQDYDKNRRQLRHLLLLEE